MGNYKTIEQLITEVEELRRKIDQILPAKQELEQAFDAVPDLISVIDKQYRIVRANKALADKLGKSPEEIKIAGLPCYRYICGHEEPPLNCPHGRMMEDGRGHSFEIHIAQFNSDYLVTASPLRDEQGLLTGSVHVARDITQKKRSEALLRESEERASIIWDNAKAGIMVIDAETHEISDLNNLAVDMIGSQKDQIVGHVCHKFICPAEQGKCPITDLHQDIDNSERVLLNAAGEKIPILKTVTSVMLGGRGHLLESFIDISERKKREEERETSHAFLQSIIDGVADSIVVFGRDYRVQLMNKAAREFSVRPLDSDEVLYCYKLFHHSDQPCKGADHPCPLEALLKTKEAFTVTHTHVDKNGEERIFEILASPVLDGKGEVVRIIEISRDVTEKVLYDQEKKKIEKRLYQEHKEQSIVTLAGGIAHDFNNIIMSVIGNAELLKAELSPETKGRNLAENIIRAGERMSDLTSLLLAYAKTGFYQRETISVNTVITAALDLVRKGSALSIETKLKLSDDVWPVSADRGQINQAFTNIFVNAFEAMEKEGGCLTVETNNIRIDQAWECHPFAQEHPAGDYVYIRIEDTGAGMKEEIRKKVFEPFFSTKFLGRGLGLAAAAGIVHKHGGCISLESEVGKGTVVHVYLPQAIEKAEVEKTERTIGADTVLVADDEPDILELLKEMIVRMGFNVMTAVNGQTALDMFKQRKEAICMAILDIQMPDMDVKQIFVEMKQLNPDLKVLISSGYDQKTALSELGTCKPDGFIQKPYGFNALRKKIREILEV
ncbi:MAG: PAS domain-containing protein [Nitrospiraceae bacterium]|nr:MAG: PAS domain-containing protein [Nitrospiraceae bacterium]